MCFPKDISIREGLNHLLNIRPVTCNKICIELKIKAPPVATFPIATIHPPTAAPRRRFIPVDDVKPKLLSMEANYVDFLNFKK